MSFNISTVYDVMAWCPKRSSDRYLWNCYGDNAYCIDFQNEKNSLHDFAHVVYDATTGEVFQIEVFNEENNPKIWFNYDYRKAYIDEARSRNVDPFVAWDNVRYTDMDFFDDVTDLLQQLEHKEEDEGLEGTSELQLELPREQLLELCLIAHEKNVTLNQLINDVLRMEIDRLERKNENDHAHG